MNVVEVRPGEGAGGVLEEEGHVVTSELHDLVLD